ncbi:hypothetical protein [Bounagaea algeriensis]
MGVSGGVDERRAARWAAAALSAGRVALGCAALVRPSLPATVWVGSGGAATVPVQVLGRALGGRDLALGVGSLHALRREDTSAAAVWLAASAVADAADVAATVAGGSALPRWGRRVVTGLAGGAVLTGGCSAAVLGAASRGVVPAPPGSADRSAQAGSM